jgi:hypothetical protein
MPSRVRPDAAGKANFAVRNCRRCHLKSLDDLALLIAVSRQDPSLRLNWEESKMGNRLLKCLIASAFAATLALAPPVLARGGGGGHGGGGGGMHGGGMGGGMHGGGMHFGGMGGGHFAGGRFGGGHFGGGHFAGARFAHAGFSPGFSRVAFRGHGFHHRFFHHRFHRFAFFGGPYVYAAYSGCWRRAWTPYGLQWVNVCSDYGYY